MAQSADNLVSLNATSGLLNAFAQTPLVALGELHGVQELADFLVALLHHPYFPDTVPAIVVEFGNARYQALLDRFLSGEPVANRELRPVWRDCFGSVAADAPIYEQFFRTVRAINRTLPPVRHIRVLLGDPPIDWQMVRDWQDIQPFLERDQHFASVVEHTILAPQRRALLIAGVAHFVRRHRRDSSQRPNVVELLDARFPGKTTVIVPHVGFSHRNAELEPLLANWPIPALVWVRGTWLGELDPRLLFAAGQSEDEADVYAGRNLQDVADGYLYLGPRATLTWSRANPAIYRGDAAYLAELERRRELLYGERHGIEDLFVERGPYYRRPGQ